VLRQLDNNWRSFFQALAAWQVDRSKFLGRPTMPGYKDKQQGRNSLIYDPQALSAPALRRGEVIVSQVDVSIPTGQTTVRQACIAPRKDYYVVEVVYEREPVPAPVNPALHAGVDFGVTHLATIASDKPGFPPHIVNGRPVKSINQSYNKQRAELQRRLGHPGATAQMERLTTHRTRHINHYLHTAS
jgi:putative transposase